MKIYILPVSGGKFTIQLGQLMMISEATERDETPFVPDVVLASSGGNVASYIAHASSWESNKIRATSSYIESDAFITNWVNIIPGFIFAPFASSIFRPGYGFKSLFRRMFSSSESVRSGSEIWTGVYQKDNRQHRLFTNKSKEDATILDPKNTSIGSLFLGDRTNAFYTGGSIDIMSDVILASASIPLVTYPVKIDGKDYLDGGIMYASPLSIYAEDIKSKIGIWTTPFEGFYFSPSTLLQQSNSSINFMEIGSLISSRSFSDIRSFISIMTFIGASEDPDEVHTNVSRKDFKTIIDSVSDNGNNHYGIILFPSSEDNKLDYTNISRGEAATAATKSANDINLIVWKFPFP